jgi:hypothetical protein
LCFSYELYIQLNSNYQVLSDRIFIKTLAESKSTSINIFLSFSSQHQNHQATSLSCKIFFLGLDKVSNLSFNDNSTDKRIALIYFNRPHGTYDRIDLMCEALDRYCPNGDTYLVNSTGNCSNCNFILISPIIRGVTYRCQAWTIKKRAFNNVLFSS